MAEDAGVPEAQTAQEIGVAKGFDLNAPLAFFIDLSPMEAKLIEAGAALEAQAAQEGGATDQTKAQGEQPSGAAEAEGSVAPEAAPRKPANQAAKAPQDGRAAMFERAEKVNELLAEMGLPAMVGVLTCTDVALAEDTLQSVLASEGSPLAGVTPEDVEMDGLVIRNYDNGKFAYFTTQNYIIGGNSIDLVKGTAARVTDPAVLRYGTIECPASVPNEMVELVRLDLLMPFIDKLMPVLAAMDPASAGMLKAQLSMMQGVSSAYTGTDPAVATLVMDDEKIDFLTRVDMASHPGLEDLVGAAQPLRLAPLLPETSQLFFSIRFNPQTKQNLQGSNQLMSALPPEVVPPNVAGMLPQFVQMIGDELTLGIAGMEGLVPNAVIMISLKDEADPMKAENTKALLQMLIPITLEETYNEVDINTVQMPLPVSLYVAYPQDVVVITTDIQAMKGLLDLLTNEQSSGLFQALDPPIDETTQRYNMLYLKTDLIAEIVPQIASMTGSMPPEASMIIDVLTKLIREVRVSQDLDGTWQRGAVSIYLKPEMGM